jgi:hypothetical protein
MTSGSKDGKLNSSPYFDFDDDLLRSQSTGLPGALFPGNRTIHMRAAWPTTQTILE